MVVMDDGVPRGTSVALSGSQGERMETLEGDEVATHGRYAHGTGLTNACEGSFVRTRFSLGTLGRVLSDEHDGCDG